MKHSYLESEHFLMSLISYFMVFALGAIAMWMALSSRNFIEYQETQILKERYERLIDGIH